MAEEDGVEYECVCQDYGNVWRSSGDNEGPAENVCPNCMSESVNWGRV